MILNERHFIIVKTKVLPWTKKSFCFSLLLHRASAIEARWNNQIVPVRLRRAQNDEYEKHEDGHFATATIRHMKDLASIFGNDCVFYLSQDKM
jgi:hypothetical protein